MSIKVCDNCGENRYKIIPSIGYFYLKCSKCNNIIEKIFMNKYNFLKSKCHYCNNSVFKANIYEEVEETKWNLICNHCGREAMVYSLNKNELENIERHNLEEASLNGGLDVLKNRVNIIEQEIKKIDSRLKVLENKIANLKEC